MCHARVDDRGRDISSDLTLLAPLPALKQFKYQGLMPPMHLRRLILEINEHLQELVISTQDYQWPFQAYEGFSPDFFHLLPDLRNFRFYLRLMTSDISKHLTSHLTKTKYFIDQHYCENVACVFSKDIGQIFSVPFAFDHFEIFEKDFFNQIQFLDMVHPALESKAWSNVQQLTLHINIYDPVLLTSIRENFTRLRSIEYRVPHFSLTPQDHELHQYDVQLRTSSLVLLETHELLCAFLGKIKELIIRDSVKHGCHVPQPLLLLTPNLMVLDIDHFYLMQILSTVGQQTQSSLFTSFSRLRRLTVRQFDERLPKYFFCYFPHVHILALVFTPYKMQIYRSELPFLGDLLQSMPNLKSLKLEHLKKPHDHHDYIDLQRTTETKLSEFFAQTVYWCKWYDDYTQKSNKYATFLCST